MPHRVLHLLAYDVRHPKRLAATLHAVRTHATGGQKSVHECFLAPGERDSLLGDLRGILNHAADGLVAIRLDPRARPRCLGIARTPADPRFFYVG